MALDKQRERAWIGAGDKRLEQVGVGAIRVVLGGEDAHVPHAGRQSRLCHESPDERAAKSAARLSSRCAHVIIVSGGGSFPRELRRICLPRIRGQVVPTSRLPPRPSPPRSLSLLWG